MCRRVLVVDDDPDWREILTLVLNCAGYEPATAANGVEALDRARADRPCLILLDMMMPVLGGRGFRREQLADPAIASIPVVCLSAIAHDDLAQELRAECLTKPVDMQRLMGLVRSHCPVPAGAPAVAVARG